MAIAIADEVPNCRSSDSIGSMPAQYVAGALVLLVACTWNHVALDLKKDDVGLDSVVLIKLAFTGLGLVFGSYGFLSDLRVSRVAKSWPGILVIAIFAMYIIASLLSDSAAAAMVSSISILAIYLLTITVAAQWGRLVTLQILFYSSAIFIAGSWLVYFVKPEIGVLLEPVGDGSFTRRMSGLSHPNTLGQYCGVNLVLGVVLYFTYAKRNWIVIGICLLAFAALINSLSRASSLAMLVAVLVGYRQFFVTRQFMLLVFLVATLFALVSVFYLAEANVEKELDRRMSMLSKSGDSEEITSGTGRIQIWAKSISLIRHRPSIGYGPATSRNLLAEYSSYTHNLILNIALSSGLIGGLLAVIMCLSRLMMLFNFRHPAADSLMAFVLVNGLVENIIFSTICGFPTAIWTLALTWFAFDQPLDETKVLSR